jgi:hypothetical protein
MVSFVGFREDEMALADWLRVFRTLHETAKKGELQGTDADDYRAGCDELARALMAAQRLTPKPGEVPRHMLRVARAVQVDLETAVTRVRATTVDLSAGGFSVLLAKPPPAEEHTANLRIPGSEPIITTVTPGEMKQSPGTVRVTFAFNRLPEPERDRLAMLVIDTALSQLAG